MTLAPFRAFIFDCDGVLVNSETLGLRSLQQALHEVGVERSLDSLARFSGRSHAETLAELEAESEVPLFAKGIAERMDECYIRLTELEGLQPCAGIPRLLLQLSACGIPFTLASSGPRRKVLFSLRAAGLALAFPRFVCGDDVARAKPAPDLYLSAATLLSVPPSACLAVEDAPNGVRAARAAGMQVVAVTNNFAASALAEADLILDSLLYLPLDFVRQDRSWLEGFPDWKELPFRRVR
ncbi:MAG TPA: HAD family phosphatase [Candidatus Limnocylindrales bacterium]|nr:HAD family phosphatase [Candidatus Limnocylindrales bacterium]